MVNRRRPPPEDGLPAQRPTAPQHEHGTGHQAHDGLDDEHHTAQDTRPSREPSQWKTAEKAIARALLCHPHLAHKAAILVPALRNWELATFISQLDHLVISNTSGTSMDALAQVQIPDRGTFPQLLREIFIARGKATTESFMTEDAACRFIEDFVQTLDEVEVRRALGEIQRAMRNADERSDMDNWKRLQTQQQELVRLLRDVSAGLDKKPPPPPTPAALKGAPEHPALPPAAAATPMSFAGNGGVPSTPDALRPADRPGDDASAMATLPAQPASKMQSLADSASETRSPQEPPLPPSPMQAHPDDDDLDDDEMFDF